MIPRACQQRRWMTSGAGSTRMPCVAPAGDDLTAPGDEVQRIAPTDVSNRGPSFGEGHCRTSRCNGYQQLAEHGVPPADGESVGERREIAGCRGRVGASGTPARARVPRTQPPDDHPNRDTRNILNYVTKRVVRRPYVAVGWLQPLERFERRSVLSACLSTLVSRWSAAARSASSSRSRRYSCALSTSGWCSGSTCPASSAVLRGSQLA